MVYQILDENLKHAWFTLCQKCYLMLKVLDEYMARLIRLLKLDSYLFSNGFGYIWIEQCVHNSRAFLSALVQRLKDQYLQSWYAELADSSKLCLYKDDKLYYEHEPDLNCLDIRTFRHTLSKLRSGCHNLEIEVGRHHGLPGYDRLCRLCKDEIENEIHFML